MHISMHGIGKYVHACAICDDGCIIILSLDGFKFLQFSVL